jgi:hypothetical protein
LNGRGGCSMSNGGSLRDGLSAALFAEIERKFL